MYSARIQFRRAQIQAKRNAEIAKQKERQLLFSGAGEDGAPRRKAAPKFTQDDLIVNASNDVTSALKRTHQTMQSELSRSQFAQQTLGIRILIVHVRQEEADNFSIEQSTAAISSLSESYSNLDTLLASSRSIVSSLLRSQKSDTWYLETAFYILIGTIIWLVFRRILYGPLWWLLWMPSKLLFRSIFAMLGVAGLTGRAQTAVVTMESPLNSVSSAVPMSSTIQSSSILPVVELSSERPYQTQSAGAVHDNVSDQIAKMVDEREAEEREGPGQEQEDVTNVDDVTPEERERQEKLPRNPKKRMWEEDGDESSRKDEL